MEEYRCPACGAMLRPGQECPFCAEARRLVERLAAEDNVRLCMRCGAVLEEGQEDLCPNCLHVRPLPTWRREDRVARWIRDRFVEPPAGQEMILCPFCQRPVPPLAIFCSYCGQKLARVDVAVAEGAVSSAEQAIPTGEGATSEAETVTKNTEMSTRPAETEGAPGAFEVVPAAEKPALFQQVRAFIREQFQPPGPQAGEGPSFWGQVWGFVRSLVRPGQGSVNTRIVLWVLLGILLLALIAMAVFWVQLLSSGGIVFR